MDTLDGVMAAATNELEGVSGKMDTAQNGIDGIASAIGTPPSGQSLVSMLQNGSSIIKSIQRLTYSGVQSTNNNIEIQPVNPTKCFVISERLCDSRDTLTNFDYVLNSTSLYIIHPPFNTGSFILGFWIVEFI